MVLNPDRTLLEDFVFEDFTLEGYDPHPAIKAPISV
jgi:thymidylate synthase